MRVFSRTMQVWCLCLRKHLGKKWHRWQWCNWSQMRFSLRFFHARLQASAANRRTISSTPLGGTYADVQTLPPFRLNWVCLLTLCTVGFLECFFPSAIRQEVYTFDAACRRSLHDWCFQLYNDEAQHVSMLHARSNLFESAGMSLPPWRVDSMDRHHVSPSHLRTVAARTQSVLRDDVFVSVFKMNSASFVALSELVLRTLLTSSKPPTRREDDKEGMLYINVYIYICYQRKFRGRNFRVTDFSNVRERVSQRKS